jgi:hypothetical protein
MLDFQGLLVFIKEIQHRTYLQIHRFRAKAINLTWAISQQLDRFTLLSRLSQEVLVVLNSEIRYHSMFVNSEHSSKHVNSSFGLKYDFDT